PRQRSRAPGDRRGADTSGLPRCRSRGVTGRGPPSEALSIARDALELYAFPRHPFFKFAWFEACEAALELGEPGQVEELLDIFDRLPPSDPTPLLIAQEMRFRGRLLALRGSSPEAAELLARSAAAF